MPIYKLGSNTPSVHPSAFIAPSADIIGKVIVGENASLWFFAVARGDTEWIKIGAGSNIQDGAVLHADPNFPCVIKDNVTVGHRSVVHGATCESGSLVGMGAIMLNGSSLGKGAMLAAGALLPEGAHVPDGMLAVGIPAKVVKPVQTGENAARYREKAQIFKRELQEIQT